MQCQNPPCERLIMDEVYYEHAWGLVLCEWCFPWGKIDKDLQSIEDFIEDFENREVEYVWDEGSNEYIRYWELLETLAIVATKLDLVHKVRTDVEDEDRSDYLWKLIEEI
jgi:hypothetical protein